MVIEKKRYTTDKCFNRISGDIMAVNKMIVNEEKDYKVFFDLYVDENNNIKPKHKEDIFLFEVRYMPEKNIWVHLVMEYYLIKTRIPSIYSVLHINLMGMNERKEKEALILISRYLSFMKDKSKVRIINSKQTMKLVSEPDSIVRFFPLIEINEENLEYLRAEVNFDKLKNPKSQIKTIEDAVILTCNRLLYGTVSNHNHLSKLRKEAFQTEEFRTLTQGISYLSLLIFALEDYAYRADALDTYKKEIKVKSKKQARLKKCDFLIDEQFLQNRLYFECCRDLALHSYDNKTIFLNYENRKLHPFIVKEMYEAVTLAEGISQLLENIVIHAGCNEKKGVGMFTISLRNFETLRALYKEKYPSYFKRNYPSEKYFCEIIISDYSGGSIPLHFSLKNKEKIRKIIRENHKDNEEIKLRDFFSPRRKEDFWEIFYSDKNNIVNHYGLQIFDSVVSTKEGFFYVKSGDEEYCNVEEELSPHHFRGTSYHIMLPFDNYIPIDENIYDLMYSYDYLSDYKDISFHEVGEVELSIMNRSQKKESIEQLKKLLESRLEKKENYLYINVKNCISFEILIKALLRLIFEQKKQQKDAKFYIILFPCPANQIINIVRILSLFYNKKGKNLDMEGVQIYIRGEGIGEEILFHGKSLIQVKNNIYKSACIRGFMFENIQTVIKILERGPL